MGAIVDRTQLERVLGYIETGREQGADLHLGGRQVLEESGGYFVEPTIFDAVSNEMRIAREEIFGPVLSAISFTDEAEAIRMSSFGGFKQSGFGRDKSLHATDKFTDLKAIWIGLS